MTGNPTNDDYSELSVQEGEIISPRAQYNELLSLDEIQRMIDEYKWRFGGNSPGPTYQ